MRLRRASVIVALPLLTSAATADAECAWVLWEHVWYTGAKQYLPAERPPRQRGPLSCWVSIERR